MAPGESRTFYAMVFQNNGHGQPATDHDLGDTRPSPQTGVKCQMQRGFKGPQPPFSVGWNIFLPPDKRLLASTNPSIIGQYGKFMDTSDIYGRTTFTIIGTREGFGGIQILGGGSTIQLPITITTQP
jgi:hypothetical protein